MIQFKPQNLRTAPEGGFPFSIKKARHVTLILIKANGEIYTGKNQGDKLDVRNRYEDGDLLMLAWTGEWSTDIFHITNADLARNFE